MGTLFINGKIVSLDSKNNFYESIGVKNNTINFLGSNEEASEVKHSYENVIDLKSKVIIPGLNDSHMHLLNYGYNFYKLELGEYDSIEEIKKEVTKIINTRQKNYNKWLLGRGWNQDKFKEKRFINKDDLDQISTEIPIIFSRVCGHIAVCNSKALEYLNIENLRNNSNVELEKGIFKEDSINILTGVISPPSLGEMKDMISKTCDELLSYGITSVQTDDFDAMPGSDYKKVFEAYEELYREGNLKVRVYEQCLFLNEEKFKEFVKNGYRTGKGDNFIKIGPLKLLLDGSLGGRTALLRDDYSDDKNNIGISLYTKEELYKYIKYAHENGFQIAAHAIGDGAMELYLNILESLEEDLGTRRHGIVHCQITANDIIEKMKKLQVMAYVQPIFLDYDMHIVEDRVGSRAKESYVFRTLRECGIKVSGGSDSPVVHFNPFENIYSAVCRKDLNGYPENGYMPKERLSVEEALRMFTIDSAYCSFEENIKGSLEVGKLADLVVLDKDIFEIPEDEIKNVKAELTMVDGEIVYRI